MVKITTFAVFFGALLLVCLVRSLRARRLWQIREYRVYGWRAAAMLFFVPIAMSIVWTHFADSCKQENGFGGRYLISTAANMRTWNFGTWSDRINCGKWRQLYSWTRHGLELRALLSFLAMLSVVTVVRMVTRRSADNANQDPGFLWRRWLEAVTCTLVYLSGPLVFFNLYFVHDYYACANTIFGVAAVGLSVVGIIELAPLGRAFGKLLAVALVVASLTIYSGYFYILQSRNCGGGTLAFCREIDQATNDGDAVIIFGHDWNPDLAYYSRRRAIYVPDWNHDSLEESAARFAAITDVDCTALVIDRNPVASLTYSIDDVPKVMERHGFRMRLRATLAGLDLYSLKHDVPESAEAN